MSNYSEAENRSLPTTRWSLVGRVREESSQGSRPALDELLRRYLPALRVHLEIRRAGTNEEIEDLIQGFIASRILESKLVTTAAQSRGKFRTLLLTSLDRYVIDQRRYASAQKRDGARNISLVQDMPGVPADNSDPAAASEFDVAWVREVLRQTVKSLRTECEAQNRSDLWKLFEARILRPALDDVEPVAYEQLVAELGFKSPTQAWNALVTVKRMFERALRSIVVEYIHDETLAEEELKDLRAVLCRGAR
jgi:DNA-directed RNA polymerase specialized sigma24 family protein